MRLWLIDLGFALIMLSAGATAGWWLRGRPNRPDRKVLVRKGTQEALAGLQQLAESVRTCIQEHTTCLRAIEAELCGAATEDPAALASAVASIRAANGEVHAKFSGIRNRLDDQADSIDESLDYCRTLLLTSLSLDRQKHQYHKVLESLQRLAVDLSQEINGCASELQQLTEEIDGSAAVSEVTAATNKMLEATDGVSRSALAVGLELVGHAEQLEMQAVLGHTDPVTLLPNHRAFEEELGRRMRDFEAGGRPLTLVRVACDGLSRINKTFGQDGGNAALRGVGSVLKNSLGENHMVARFGGDELVVLLSETTMAQALPLAERLRQAVENASHRHGKQTIRATASLGVAQVVTEERAQSTLERCSEARLAAEQAGGNKAYWHDGRECHPVHAVYQQAAGQGGSTADADRELDEATGQSPRDGECRATVYLSGRSVFLDNLRRRMVEWQRGGPPVSILLVRVDQYDVLLREFGPQVREFLRDVVGRVMEAATRDMDQRCEYDEQTFAVLLPGGDQATGERVARRVRSQMGQCQMRVNDQAFQLSATVSHASCQENDTMMDLVLRAEKQLPPSACLEGERLRIHDPAIA